MSSQIITLKARADSQGPSRIPALEISRLSCSAGDTQLGAGFCRDLQLGVLHGRWPSCGVAEKARIGRDLFPCLPRKEMDARHPGRGMTVMTAI
jgi:hypothetical protein